MSNGRFQFIIGADTKEAQRGLRGLEKEFERAGKLLKDTERRGFFSKKQAKEMDGIARQMNSQLSGLKTGYRSLTREIERMEEVRYKSGKRATYEEKKQLQALKQKRTEMKRQAADLERHARKVQQQAERRVVRNYPSGAAASRSPLGNSPAPVGSRGFPMMGGAVGIALASAMSGGMWLKGQMDQGEATLTQNSLQRMQSERLTGRRGGFTDLGRTGRGLGYTTAQAHQFHQMTSRAIGGSSVGATRSNMQLMRGFSMDPGSIMALQQSSRHAGGMVDPVGLNRALIQAVRMGGFSRALTGEFASSLTSLVASTAESQENVSAKRLAGTTALLSSRLGGAYKRSPQRTSKLLQGLHGTIQAPGGGEAGQAFMLRAMGMGSGTGYVKALEMMDKGITDPKNLQRIVTQIKKEHKTEDMQALALRALSGGRIKIHQSRRLMRMNASGFTKEGVNKALDKVAVDTKKEADKSRAGTALMRRKIAKQETQASARQATDSVYKLSDDFQKAMLKAWTGLMENMLDAFKKGFLSGLWNIFVGQKKGPTDKESDEYVRQLTKPKRGRNPKK